MTLGISGRKQTIRIVNPSSQSFISASDFTFLGGFKLPALWPTADQNYARGLTFRYKSGSFRLMTLVKGDNASDGQAVHLYELSVPTLQSTVGAYNSATITTHYGSSLWGGRMNVGGPDDASKDYRSLYWDETLSKLFFVACSSYSSTAKHIIGVATLNDVTPSSSTSTGMWSFSNLSYKAIKGICPIPTDRVTSGRRLLAGFGGYESVIAAGPAHMGPAAVAFNPDTMLAASVNTAISGQSVLASHPYRTGTKYVSTFYGVRDSNYYSTMDWDWNPNLGVGYFGSADTIDQSGLWIETSTKKGFLLFASLHSNGNRVNLDNTFDPVFVSKTGDANGNTWTYDIRTATPMGLQVGQKPFVGNTWGGWSLCTVVSASGTNVRIAVEVSVQDNGGSGPVPNKNSQIFLGSSYFSAQIRGSQHTTTMFCYDPDELLSATNPLPFVSQETFTGPARVTLQYDYGDNTRIFGATFDPSTNRMYLLTQGGLIGVYQLAS